MTILKLVHQFCVITVTTAAPSLLRKPLESITYCLFTFILSWSL